MRQGLRDHSLSLFFLFIFVAAIIGQSFAGQRAYNAEQTEHGQEPLSWWGYVSSVDFGGAVMENWQSEFLQFTLFIGATIWLVQRGSPESKRPEEAGLGNEAKQRIGRHAREDAPGWAKANGIRTRVYEHSLLIVMTLIFFGTWFAQSLNNWRRFNEDQVVHDEAPVSWGHYLLNADFWERTLENWQSEFLAVGTFAVFTIYLRQRGSPESKPVGAPHDETGTSG
jgi:hypothetical protein